MLRNGVGDPNPGEITFSNLVAIIAGMGSEWLLSLGWHVNRGFLFLHRLLKLSALRLAPDISHFCIG
jgi:hypothetical protein